MTNEGVLELAMFRVMTGTRPEALRAAVEATDRWVRAQPGFVARTLRIDRGSETYVDVVEWRSAREAKDAAERIMTAPECHALMALIDPESVHMLHAEPW